MIVVSNVGDRIASLRRRMNLTQEGFSEKVGISRAALSHYEKNRREPDYETINRMADFFEVTTDYLLGRSDRESLTEKESEEYNEIISTIKKLEESGKEKELEALKAYTKFLANALENED